MVVGADIDCRDRSAMTYFFTAAAVVACPLAMGAMMWMMMRGNGGADTAAPQELQALRAEIDQLKSGRGRTL